MTATEILAVMGGLKRGQAVEFLENIGRRSTLRLVRHLAAMTPKKFRGDEAFDMWRDFDLITTALDIVLPRAS